ncbi:1-(5-phosphoribosyl)-5-[(5-phosphoribosylamino)methylideneamino]imidazole-4-carboxamide isomerase [Gabonibacter chumensis]|uniref:1-(5-phosphoribosyl)-5-[(5- phosphoribosylamino)methylideneamino]imidazole-4- carboxamide isomerase n=1 Tax=Gabonibacter chumensis TaxID=2972474 RepID=UPI002574638C|nr:1-(5-phosphoribosyl)-5-[(5-phosphoribosylamino)methylideneamino]imidazole-4-carboxamide isomerase [Gabonibacter chumensis]MCR9012876.1 1-(5-phosphoribosyl)-5-[(5-phosphoribosylamino)methylideneamino]imidazole-4-carboxamide isomerase [Gabonibacter chumensis]
MEIIPAIDLMGGRCVRLSQGDYDRCSVYTEDPVGMALCFEKAGVGRLHLVDLDGTRKGKVAHLDLLREICSLTRLEVDFSGGIKSEGEVQQVLEAGARWVTIGSMAQTNPEKVKSWITKYGAERIIIAADVREERVYINGWRRKSDKTIFDLIEQYDGVLMNLMCTDIERDGMFSGPSSGLYGKLRTRFPEIKLIASGGVRSVEDVKALYRLGVTSVIIGKAFYEGRLTWEEIVRMKL